MLYFVNDLNDFSEYTNDELIEEVKEDNLYSYCLSTLRHYYDNRSDYGDSIKAILKYVPDDKLVDLLEDHDFYLYESRQYAINYIEENRNNKGLHL